MHAFLVFSLLWLTAETHGVKYIKTENECTVNWFQVFENDAYGKTVSGSRTELRNAVSSGADVKILNGVYMISRSLSYWISSRQFTLSKSIEATVQEKKQKYFSKTDVSSSNVVVPSWDAQLRLQNLKTIGQNVCGQSIFNLGVKDFETLADNATWRFHLFCTTGDVDISIWYVGKHERANDVRLNLFIQWFVRFSSTKEPIIQFNKNGKITKGSLSAATDAANSGADFKVVRKKNGEWYSAHFDNIWTQNTAGPVTMSGLSIWHVSQKVNGDHYVFKDNAYWWMTMWATNGVLDRIKWLVGRHQSPGGKPTKTKQTWYSDPCWELAYKYDAQGNPLDGSFDKLRTALESGHRTKVVFGNNPYLDRQSIEPDLVIIFGKEVDQTVQLQILGMFINNISKASIDKIAKDTFWYWQVYIRVNGIVTVYQWDVGRHKERGIFSFNTSATWFVDTRTWTKQLSNDDEGNVVFGSKQNLISQIRQGADIRLKFNLPVNPPAVFETIVITPDNLNITQDSGEVQISSIQVRSVDASPASKPNDTVWWFNMGTTTGKFDVSRWSVGRYEDRNHNSFQVPMDWFANP